MKSNTKNNKTKFVTILASLLCLSSSCNSSLKGKCFVDYEGNTLRVISDQIENDYWLVKYKDREKPSKAYGLDNLSKGDLLNEVICD